MRTALICEQWRVPVASEGHSGLPWFLDWAERRPREVSDHTACGYWAYSALANNMLEFESASEYFGGLGFQSSIIRGLFPLVQHDIADISSKSCAHLISLFGNERVVKVHCVDTTKHIMPDAELVTFDCGDFTALTLTRHNGEILSRILERKPKALVITDIAGPRLHLQKERYSKILSVNCDKYTSYLHGLAEYIRQTLGYDALAIYYTRWSAVMALLPREQVSSTADPQYVPESPVGFQWVKDA